VDLRDPIERARHAAEPAFAQAGASIEWLSSDTEDLTLSGDSSALEQVFLNLLLNAAQALGPGGRAEIAARRLNAHIEVTVSDNGPGITHEFRDRIFEVFFSTKPEGTGLGLAIARQIIVAHGGRIVAEENESGGTTMRVWLPNRNETVSRT
jgi:signal transduction histidine kinase